MFDLKTLRLISMVSFLCFTFANLIIWRLVPQERALKDWVWASAALGLGLLLLGLYGSIPDFLSLATGNALIMLSLGWFYVGTRKLMGSDPGFGWHWLATGLVFVLCLTSSSVAVRVMGTSALYVPFMAACAVLFWRSPVEPGLQLIKRVAAVIFAAGAVLSVLRVVNPPAESVSTAEFMRTAGGLQVAPYMFLIMFGLWLPISLLTIASVRLQNQRQALAAQEDTSIRKLRDSEAHYRSLIEWSPNAIAVHRDGRLLYVNPTARKMFRAGSDQDMVGLRILDLTHPDFHDSVMRRARASVTHGHAESAATEKFLRLDGTPFEVEIQSTAVIYEGEPAIHTSLRDVTERMRTDAELRIAAIAFESQDGMMITDANQVILRVNHAFTDITGYSAAEAIGKTPSLLSSGRHDPNFYAAMWHSIEQTGSWRGEIWDRRKNGDIYPEQLTITAVTGPTGKVVNYVAVLHDITQRKQLEADVQKLAFYDPLTGLPNRRLFNDRLTQTLARARRSQSRMALMFIDLDKFKPINDTHGHEVGDWALEVVARRLEGCLRATDTAARVGGDEFLVLLPDLQSCEDGLAVAEKIRLALAQTLTTSCELALQSSASIGLAVYPDHGNTEQDLLRLGDGAMYEAKKLGGNHVCMAALSAVEPLDEACAAGQSIVRLTWKAAFATGNSTIDDEHRTLFQLGNVLLDKAVSRAESPTEFDAAFDALLAHVVDHFDHEEKILEALGYLELTEHIQIHQDLVARALQLRHPPEGQPAVSVGDLVEFLVTDIIARHMLIEDRKFFHLLAQERQRVDGALPTTD